MLSAPEHVTQGVLSLSGSSSSSESGAGVSATTVPCARRDFDTRLLPRHVYASAMLLDTRVTEPSRLVELSELGAMDDVMRTGAWRNVNIAVSCPTTVVVKMSINEV